MLNRLPALLVAFLAALLAGCGNMLPFAYNHGDLAIRMAVNDYFEFDSAQGDAFRSRLARFHAWHRRNELPEYAAIAAAASQRLAHGLTAEDVRWGVDRVRTRYRLLATQAVEESAPVLATLNDANLRAVERKFAESNAKLEREVFVADARKRERNRMRDLRKRFEDWLGDLTPEQEARLAAYVRESPQFSRERMAERKRRQREFVELLRDHRHTPDFAARLRAYFVDYERHRSPEYQRFAREWEESLVRLVVDLDSTLTSAQRKRGVERFAGYAEDLRRLARVDSRRRRR